MRLGDVERGLACLVLQVLLRAAGEQRLRDLRVAELGRLYQRSVSLVVLCVDVQLEVLHQEARDLLVSPEHGFVQGRAVGAGFGFMHVGLGGERLRALRAAVHAVVAELGAGLLLVRGGLLLRLGNAEVDELAEGRRKVREERLLRLGVLLDVRLELVVLDQRQVGGKHHQRAGLLVLVLFRPVPLALLPGVLEQELEVIVVELQRIRRPRPVEATASLVAAAEGVRAAQDDDLLVVEPHAVEHVAKVFRSLSGIGKAAIRRNVLAIAIGASELEGDLRPTRLLNRNASGVGPDVSERNLRVLLANGQQQVAHDP
mmetsp:Transcript_490/g.932  ORF Transcript_490/g.932 Transcript_490/m.932 type:complete len:315 (+) Transcript_490:486-1430(+)